MTSRDIIFSFVHRYQTVGLKSEFHGTMGSVVNIREKGLSFECSLGKKLYSVQAKSECSFSLKGGSKVFRVLLIVVESQSTFM